MTLRADTNDVMWTVNPTSDEPNSYPIWGYGGQRDPSLAGLFHPNQSGLVILNATIAPNEQGPISTAGLYIGECSNSRSRTAAKLVVVREYFNRFYIISYCVEFISSPVAVVA